MARSDAESAVAEALEEGLDLAMIRRVVAGFYAHVRRDPLIGPVFHARIAPDHWPAHEEKIAQFWSSALLGSRSYQGQPMPKHQAIPELGDAQFRRWLAIFRHTVRDLCPERTAALFVARSERVAEAFRMNLSTHRGGAPVFQPPLTREDWTPPA